MRPVDDSGEADAVAQKFVGRTEELATVARSLDQSIGGRTQVVWIEGEPGSGKTGLLNASIRLLPSSFRVLRAEADESAIGVDMELVRQFGPVAAADGFAAGLQLLDFFDTAQDAGPLAIAVEDLHWADLASRRALLTVARRLRNDHVILFITSRPFWVDDGWERFVTDPERCNRITVKGLTVSDIAELARRLGKQLDRRSTERLHRHTQGHALYVQTLLIELSLEQLTSAEADLPAPRSLASTTTARVADLPNEPRLLASALAVVNQRRALGTIATIANVSDPERALEPLLDTGFVTWSPGELGTPVEFTHPLFRSAIYEDLSPASRRDLHLAAAELLDPEASLVHRVAAASPGDEALVDDLIAAADREVDRGALGLAARNLLWASSLSADLVQIEGGLLRATRLLLDDGQVDQAKTVRDQIMAVRVGPVRSLLLGQLAWTDGDAVTSERWLVEAVHLADDDPQAHWVEIDALIQLARLYGTEGRGSKAREAASHALALQPEDEAAEVNAWCELATAEALLRGAPASLDLLADRLGADPRSIVSADADLLVIRGALGFFAGRTHSAIADLRIALDLARLGAPAAQLARAHIQLAQLLISAGDWDEAILHARLGISVVEDGGQVWLEAQAHAALASVRASRGEWELAADHISQARRAAGAIEGC